MASPVRCRWWCARCRWFPREPTGLRRAVRVAFRRRYGLEFGGQRPRGKFVARIADELTASARARSCSRCRRSLNVVPRYRIFVFELAMADGMWGLLMPARGCACVPAGRRAAAVSAPRASMRTPAAPGLVRSSFIVFHNHPIDHGCSELPSTPWMQRDGGNAHGGRQTCWENRDHHRGGGDTGGVRLAQGWERAAATPAKLVRRYSTELTGSRWPRCGRSGKARRQQHRVSGSTCRAMTFTSRPTVWTSKTAVVGRVRAFARIRQQRNAVDGRPRITEEELPKADALQAHGIAQTALHKHSLQQDPPAWWTHIHCMGDAARLAPTKAARWMPQRSAPPTPPPARQPPVDTSPASTSVGPQPKMVGC